MPIVTVDWVVGRSVDQREQLVVAITDILVRIGGVRAEAVEIILREHSPSNWGKGGALMERGEIRQPENVSEPSGERL